MNVFLRQWQVWRRKGSPFRAFLTGNRQAVTYGLELDLDHVRSSIESLVDGHMAGRKWDFHARINEELANLQRAEAEVTDLTQRNVDVSTLNEWIAETRDLLAEFRRYLG